MNASQSKPNNPFYIILLVAGVLFLVTACSYFVMTLRGRDARIGDPEDPSSQRFVQIVEQYGFAALMIELGVLAGATVGAIGTDEYWSRREQEQLAESNEESDS